MTDFRNIIIEDLEILRKKEQQERNVFKVRAYDKVLKELRTLNKPIKTLEDIEDVPGIGARIKEKIREIIETGVLKVAENIKADSGVNATDLIMGVYGIGAVKANDLIKNHNIRSIADLREAVAKNPKLLNEKQKIGLKYFEDIQERIPRKEMEQHEKEILKIVSNIDKSFKAIVVGSYRREAVSSGDIDVLIGYPEGMLEKDAEVKFKEIVQEFEDKNYITDILAKGPKKCLAVAKLTNEEKSRRLDLLLTPPEEFPYALLYFTGSDKFNIKMRKKAIEMGYSLSEHGLKIIEKDSPASQPPVMKTEKDVFEFLDIPYLSPKER